MFRVVSFLLMVVIFSVLVSYMTMTHLAPHHAITRTTAPQTAPAPTIRTTYDRVMETGKIRCGYVPYPPVVMKDPNTGKFSGVVVDLMTEIGKLLDLEIVWAEEVGWATTVTGLQNNRYDMMCVGYWRNSLEAKHVGYTLPFSYNQVGVFVRADDTRFDDSLDRINQEGITIASSDGELASAIARRDFPKAALNELPNLTDPMQVFEEVKFGKADVTFREVFAAQNYIDSNPGTIKRIHADKSLRIFQNTLALPMDDVRLKSMVDTAIIEIVENGQMDKILDKHDPNRLYLRVAKPYRSDQ